MAFAEEMSWNLEGSETLELRMMKDEDGGIYAIRLSNPSMDEPIYADPESFILSAKEIFDKEQDLSQDQTLSTLKEVFNRAVQNIADPKEELQREMSSGELAAHNAMAPPGAA